MFQCMCFLLIIAVVKGQIPLESASSNALQLTIEKISKVMRDDDPTGKNHSTKVVIARHPPLENVVEWKLIFQSDDSSTRTLNISSDGSKPSTQTEFIFDGNLPDSKSIFLQARNDKEVVAMDFLGLPVIDLESRVAWVGDEKSSSFSSMRVEVGSRLHHISIDSHNCTSSESPCYFIAPDPRPAFVERCLHASLGSSKTVKLCDEREASFIGMLPMPFLSLREDGVLEVTYLSHRDDFHLEVLAYDPANHSVVYSNSSYRCYVPVYQKDKTDGKTTCLHEISFPKDKDQIMVLVVQVGDEGYVLGSSLQMFQDNQPDIEMANVLIASFVGVMIGLAVLILIGMLIVRVRMTRKRKKREAEERQGTNQGDGEAEEPCLVPSRVTST